MMRGCVLAIILSALLFAVVFSMGTYVTGKIGGGGAAALAVGVFSSLSLLGIVLTGKAAK